MPDKPVRRNTEQLDPEVWAINQLLDICHRRRYRGGGWKSMQRALLYVLMREWPEAYKAIHMHCSIGDLL